MLADKPTVLGMIFAAMNDCVRGAGRQLVHEAIALDEGNEVERHDEATSGMMPAGEDLKGFEGSGAESRPTG